MCAISNQCNFGAHTSLYLSVHCTIKILFIYMIYSMQARVSLDIQLMIASINVRQRGLSIVIKLSAMIPPRLDVGYRISRGLPSDTCKSIITGSTNRYFFHFTTDRCKGTVGTYNPTSPNGNVCNVLVDIYVRIKLIIFQLTMKICCISKYA